MNIYFIIKLVSLVFHVFLGMYALLRSPKNGLNQAFFLTATSIAVIELGFLMSFIGLHREIWLRIAFGGQYLMSANFISLSLFYGRDNYEGDLKSRRYYLVALYIISIILFFVTLTDIFELKFLNEQSNSNITFNKLTSLLFLYPLICILFALVILENTYRYSMKNNKRIRYPIIVFIGMLISYILLYSQALSFGYIPMDFISAISVISVISNIVITYPIIKPKKAETRIYIRRNMIAKSYTVLLAGLYLLIIGILGKIIQIVGKNLSFFIAFLVAFFVLLLLIAILMAKPFKQRIQTFIEKNFYRSKYDYRDEWDKFSKNVFSILSINELLHKILETISETFKAYNAFIMLLDESRREFFVAASLIEDQKIQDIIISEDNVFIDWLWRYGSPIRIHNGKYIAKNAFGVLPNIPDSLLDTGKQNRICVPITIGNRLIAVLIIDHEYIGKNDTSFHQEDINLLETMSKQISIAIMNAKKSQELAISKELESFNKLSAIILHDLKSSVSMLSLVVQNAASNIESPEFQKDAFGAISNAVYKIQRLILRLSSTQNETESQNFHLSDLNEIIGNAINSSGISKISRISLIEEFSTIPKAVVNPENMERVISNLLINAVESITDNGTIKVKTDCDANGHILVSVSDSGCGMSQDFTRYRLFQPFQTTKVKGMGIGLYQCKSVIEACNGSIEVQSQEGMGSTFTIKFPIPENLC
jgi:putative PEP-CTERM system histidine kinase